VDDAIGKQLLDFIPNPIQKQHFHDVMEMDMEIENYELELLTGTKTVKTCLISASYQLENDEEKYIQGIIHDITNLKKAEAATIQAEKLAASGRFIRTLAHEVRNPLNNINLSVENLIEQSEDEDEKMYLEIIQRNGKRINDLITELLQSARPSEMNLGSVLLQDVVRQVIDSVADRAMLRNITIRYMPAEQELMLKADASKLIMAILNIVINAIEAVEDNTGLIDITVTPKNKYVLLEISDNGAGISPENKSRLFEPYFTSKRNGMGLGLATTLTILRAHNADIEVDSELEHGTTFRLIFPGH
jgi:signal transduction histidine kinase